MLTPDANKRNHALNQTLAGLDRATRLVEQMLRLARLDPLAALPNPTPVNLGELMRDVTAGTRDTSEKCAIDVDIGDGKVIVEGVPDLLQIALRNLIDNAVRYSPAGSRITVALRAENGRPVMSVADNGPGVGEGELPRLIERFYRSAEAVAEGSGLGLTIVQRIAELHGARLELVNRATGGLEARLRWNAGRASAV
jgi:two-component system sensor histidine kinase QseC